MLLSNVSLGEKCGKPKPFLDMDAIKPYGSSAECVRGREHPCTECIRFEIPKINMQSVLVNCSLES